VGPVNSGSITLTSAGSGNSPISIDLIQLAPATVNQAYGPVQLQATGGTQCSNPGMPYTWTWTGNMLPAGMQLTSAGVLQGTPQRAASYQLPITATDCSSPPLSETVTFSLVVNPGTTPALMYVTPQNLPAGSPGDANYSVQLAVTGGNNTPATYTPAPDGSQGVLNQAGLTVSSTGLISVIPGQQLAPGVWSFAITATENCTGCSVTQEFTVNVTAGPLSISGATSVRIDPSKPLPSFTWTAQGGTPQYNWAPASQYVGNGLSISCSGATCTLTGTPYGPTEPNLDVTYLQLMVTDSAAPAASQLIHIVVVVAIPNPPPLTPAGPVTSTATSGVNYLSTGFNAGVKGGLPPSVCTPAGNQALQQAGISLEQIGSWCALAGVPTTPGSYPFTGNVTDQKNDPPVAVPLTVDVQASGNTSDSSTQAIRPRRDKHPASLEAPPSINNGGVIDIAAYQPVLTPGGIMSIYGSNLADSVYPAPSSGPLPTSLGNVQVTINGENAALFYVSPAQINFHAPLDPLAYYPLNTPCLQNPTDPGTFLPVGCPAPGSVAVTVIRDGIASAAASVPVSTSAAAVLTLPGSFAIATHTNYQLITQTSPAQAGEVIVIYGAGIGYPMCDVVAGYPSGTGCLANVPPQFSFPDYPDLNGSYKLLFAGLTPGAAGLAQYNLQLPASLPSAAMASGSIRMRIGDPTAGETFNLYLPGSASTTVPVISSLSQSSATAGSGNITLTVNGSNFGSGAVVEWNGVTALPVLFSSSTQLTVIVGANLLSSAGTASITVVSQGLTSGPVSFTVTPQTASCATYPSGFVPFTSVAYQTAADSAGDTLLVGTVSQANLAMINNLPLPTSSNQQFCGAVNLGGGYTVQAYVPTQAERAGNFSPFSGLLIDPLNNMVFPDGIIPVSLLGQVYAWRIPAQAVNTPFTYVAIPATNNIQSGLLSTFPTGIFTANNSLATPFNIPGAVGNCGPAGNSPCNFYDGFGFSGNGNSIVMNVSIASPTDVYTLMNAYQPPAGEQLATIQFIGGGGASLTFSLIGGEDIRDYYQGGFVNSLSNGVSGVEAVNAFSCTDPTNCLGSGGTGDVETGNTGGYVIDEQHFSLGAAFAGQTLTQIIITDTNDGSNPILLGITVQ
jgi:hypothetical protein